MGPTTYISSLVLNEVALLPGDWVHNLGGFLKLYFLMKEQVAAVALPKGKGFHTNPPCVTVVPLAGPGAHSYFGQLTHGLLQCILHEVPLENFMEAAANPGYRGEAIMGLPPHAHIKPLLSALITNLKLFFIKPYIRIE